MTTVGGLPAHILLVHAIVVLLPLTALLLVASAVWPAARRRVAGPNAVLAVLVLALVPVTTDAGEWLERRVQSDELVRAHTELGDTALYVAAPVALLALVVWWRGREAAALARSTDHTPGAGPGADGSVAAGSVATKARPTARRTLLAPASRGVTVAVAVLAVLAAGAAVVDVYVIGESGARATWEDGFSQTPLPPRG